MLLIAPKSPLKLTKPRPTKLSGQLVIQHPHRFLFWSASQEDWVSLEQALVVPAWYAELGYHEAVMYVIQDRYKQKSAYFVPLEIVQALATNWPLSA